MTLKYRQNIESKCYSSSVILQINRTKKNFTYALHYCNLWSFFYYNMSKKKTIKKKLRRHFNIMWIWSYDLQVKLIYFIVFFIIGFRFQLVHMIQFVNQAVMIKQPQYTDTHFPRSVCQCIEAVYVKIFYQKFIKLTAIKTFYRFLSFSDPQH